MLVMFADAATSQGKNNMSYKFFQNTSCEFFPCHKYPFKNFNCLFCYCPLYNDKNCGGNFTMVQLDNGNWIKDCTECILPHKPENYDYVIKKLYENNHTKAGE